MKNPFDFFMQQAKQVQEQMQSAQENLSKIEIQGEAGAGMVQITLNGRYKPKKVYIDPEVLKEPKEVLEELILSAMASAVGKVEEQIKGKMGSVSGLAQNFSNLFASQDKNQE
ncbi:MAG: YbaB/EbfC family nucleoid-associated protein [Gammaproteobacteria bacterium]